MLSIHYAAVSTPKNVIIIGGYTVSETYAGYSDIVAKFESK